MRLLLAGYGLAAAGAAAHLAAGGGALAALLGFWLGGAAAVVALAVTPGLSRPFRRAERAPEETEAAEAAALARALALWEADRRADAPGTVSGEAARRRA